MVFYNEYKKQHYDQQKGVFFATYIFCNVVGKTLNVADVVHTHQFTYILTYVFHNTVG